MILRRLTEHVKAQNWFAVAIDFFIVVVGVFIGIQIANWNAARQDERIAQEYIARIQEDLLANQRDMLTRIAFFTTLRTHLLGALDALDDPPEPLGRKFIIDSFIGSFTVARPLGRDTYDELASGGAGNTALDVGTRQRLAQFYRVMEGSEIVLLRIPPYLKALQRSLPYPVQAHLKLFLFQTTIDRAQTLYDFLERRKR